MNYIADRQLWRYSCFESLKRAQSLKGGLSMVSRTSILLGEDVEGCADRLLQGKLITNWQNLAPEHVNKARILIVAQFGEQDYERLLDKVIAYAAQRRVVWQHEDYTTYGDPRIRQWIPPLP